MKPKISIITINYNNLEGLKKTFNSVFSQTWNDFEYIVIDGASTDGSKEFIEKNKKNINYWISEQDEGVYHAMNKGIKKANGEYLLFLNSGDHFFNNKILEKNIKHLSEKDIIYSDLQVVESGKTFIKKYPETLSFSYFIVDTLPHPATFIKKGTLVEYGFYDESFKIAADWKFFIDGICRHNLSYKKVNSTFSTFYIGGMSSNPDNRLIKQNEIDSVLNEEYSAFTKDFDDIVVKNDKLNSLRKSRIIYVLVKLGFLNKF